MKLKCQYLFLLTIGLLFLSTPNFTYGQENTGSENYLDSIKAELQKPWPNNRTINLVFHGHSVPTGYRTMGIVKPLESYPHETLKLIKEDYPYAVLNVITTSIGGEQAEQAAKRFKEEVLIYRPDVLFIDYALNDRSIGLERAKKAWEQMVEEALEENIKVILLTPTPDFRENILSPDAELAKHSQQIHKLAEKYEVGLVDSYAAFKELSKNEPLAKYMAQNNHINDKGHEIVAKAIYAYFKKQN